MARGNFPLLALNRGLISPLGLARVDLDRTALSAEICTNYILKTIGAMRLRPGTKYLGSSYNDTGAYWIEFVAATDDTALLELTPGKMRVWIDDALLERPFVDTTVTLSDTGWDDVSTGGSLATPPQDVVPIMTADTTNGVTVSASSVFSTGAVYYVHDGNSGLSWLSDTGVSLPQWVKYDFGAGNNQRIRYHVVQAQSTNPGLLAYMPSAWEWQSNDVDTGNGWTTEVTVTGQTAWALGEQRTYTDTGYTDTGGNSRRYWRMLISANDGGSAGNVIVADLQAVAGASLGQVSFASSGLTLNAQTTGALAKATKRVLVDTGDIGVEHSFAINVNRGPVTFRVGSTSGDDDYIRETSLGTGYHNLALTPTTDMYLTLQSDATVNRIVSSLTIGDTGTVEVTAPWAASDLDNIRFDQSADVVYVDAVDVKQRKIERRGTGRSWSVVDYSSDKGPFLSSRSSSAKLNVDQTFGNTVIRSDIPFFQSGHVGGIFRIFHGGQSGTWNLGAQAAVTDAIEVTGINDTGTTQANRERYISFAITASDPGVFTSVLERSFDGEDIGFHATDITDTGSGVLAIEDPDDNIKVWYRVRISSYTSGTATVTATYANGGITGIAKATDYVSNQAMNVEVVSRFSDTGHSDNWQEGSWSGVRGYPGAIALHEGRLCHAGGASIYMSVSDDYENFDDGVIGDAGPIVRTLGSGPVDSVYYLLSLQRLIAGTTGAEIAVRSSSLDEPLTAENSSAKIFSTQGSANLRSLLVDNRAIFVQRSKQRLSSVGFGTGDISTDFESAELTFLVPELLKAGVVSIAVQRRPDTRIHCVLADGNVAILTYEPQEQVLGWTMWETDGSVERVVILPGIAEDAVYYHINRTVNGTTKRFLERWASETESQGDTGLSWLADCAVSYTDTGRATVIPVDHLVGASVVAWGNDTGQTNAGMDLSPDDTGGDPTLYTVDTGGDITLSVAKHHVVVGLPYVGDFRSTKLAYAAQAGTALTQQKRVSQIGFVLAQTHNNALLFGSDTGHLDPMPRNINGAPVDADRIYTAFDQVAIPFPGTVDPDSRVHIRARAPRPATVMAAVATVQTNERV